MSINRSVYPFNIDMPLSGPTFTLQGFFCLHKSTSKDLHNLLGHFFSMRKISFLTILKGDWDDCVPVNFMR